MYVIFFVFVVVQQVSSVPSNIIPWQAHFSTASVCIPYSMPQKMLLFLWHRDTMHCCVGWRSAMRAKAMSATCFLECNNLVEHQKTCVRPPAQNNWKSYIYLSFILRFSIILSDIFTTRNTSPIKTIIMQNTASLSIILSLIYSLVVADFFE